MTLRAAEALQRCPLHAQGDEWIWQGLSLPFCVKPYFEKVQVELKFDDMP